MADWPVALPQTPLAEGFGQALGPDTVLRTSMDQGPDKTRRRSTDGPVDFQARLVLTDAQRQVLVDFLRNDIADGALSFNWKDHTTGGAAVLKIVVPPVPALLALGGGLWSVTLPMEILP